MWLKCLHEIARFIKKCPLWFRLVLNPCEEAWFRLVLFDLGECSTPVKKPDLG